MTEGERSEGRATRHSVDPERASRCVKRKGPGARAPGRFLGVNSMPMRTFMIPVTDCGDACDAMNQFMRHVRVLSTDRRFVEIGLQSFWSILVDYLEVKPETMSGEQRPTKFVTGSIIEKFSIQRRLHGLLNCGSFVNGWLKRRAYRFTRFSPTSNWRK